MKVVLGGVLSSTMCDPACGWQEQPGGAVLELGTARMRSSVSVVRRTAYGLLKVTERKTLLKHIASVKLISILGRVVVRRGQTLVAYRQTLSTPHGFCKWSHVWEDSGGIALKMTYAGQYRSPIGVASWALRSIHEKLLTRLAFVLPSI